MKEHDSLRRFLFEILGVRGEWVHLDTSWQKTKKHQQLGDVAQEQLGQMVAASVLLSATIKFEGSIILQAQGNGALKTLVAQATHHRKVRGLARGANYIPAGSSLNEIMGEGRLVITVEPNQGEPYQGIVALQGNTLSDVIGNYFLQSEQLNTQVWLFADESSAAGLFLQELPAQENYPADWERISILANTLTKEEILSLDCEEILYRLFNEEHVRIFESEAVEFECSCSRQKIENTLISLGQEELKSMLQEPDDINVDCEFCGKQHVFNKQALETLLKSILTPAPSKHLH